MTALVIGDDEMAPIKCLELLRVVKSHFHAKAAYANKAKQLGMQVLPPVLDYVRDHAAEAEMIFGHAAPGLPPGFDRVAWRHFVAAIPCRRSRMGCDTVMPSWRTSSRTSRICKSLNILTNQGLRMLPDVASPVAALPLPHSSAPRLAAHFSGLAAICDGETSPEQRHTSRSPSSLSLPSPVEAVPLTSQVAVAASLPTGCFPSSSPAAMPSPSPSLMPGLALSSSVPSASVQDVVAAMRSKLGIEPPAGDVQESGGGGAEVMKKAMKAAAMKSKKMPKAMKAAKAMPMKAMKASTKTKEPMKAMKRPAAAAGLVLGCSKCRGSEGGCSQCKNPAFTGKRGPR